MACENSISIKSIISKVLTDNNIQDESIRPADMIEWAAEALERIGAFTELDYKIAGKGGEPLIEIVDYQAALPVDLHSIVQVAWSYSDQGRFYPMRSSTGSFDPVRGKTIIVDDSDPQNIVYGTEDEKPDEMGFNTDAVYYIAPGYIKTNVKEGYLLLAYRSIPLDDEGYPKMPDNHAFKDALYWYITMKLLYPKWVIGEVRDGIYYNARSSWNYYSKQAYGNVMMPKAGELEAIKNTWNKLVPEMREHDTFYSTIGEEQYIRNQTNKNYGKL